MKKRLKRMLEEEIVIVFILLFLVVGTCIAGNSKTFMTVRLGETVKFIHVQLVDYFVGTIGLERDVTSYISHEVAREDEKRADTDEKEERKIVIVH